MAETQFVDVVAKSTGEAQRVPAHFLELGAAGIEPFTDFEPAKAEGNAEKPARGSKTKEGSGA